MTWAKASASMLNTTLTVFGERCEVLYIRGPDQVPLSKAVFDENFQSVDPNTGAAIISDTPMIGVALADLPGGVWREGDVVKIRGLYYRAVEPQKDSEGHAKIILHRLKNCTST